MISPALRLLGDSWTLLILDEAMRGAHRFSDWRDRLAIPNSVLSHRLTMLVDHAIFAHPQNANYPGYTLTRRGEALWMFIASLHLWQERWESSAPPTPPMIHSRCGRHCTPKFSCTCAPLPVFRKDLSIVKLPESRLAHDVHSGLSGRHRNAGGHTSARAGRGHLHRTTLRALGSRWSVEILVAALWGARRFKDFTTRLAIPSAVLSGRLRGFVELGLMRVVTKERPDRSYYELTDKGTAFSDSLIFANTWGRVWMPDMGDPQWCCAIIAAEESSTRYCVAAAATPSSTAAKCPGDRGLVADTLSLRLIEIVVGCVEM